MSLDLGAQRSAVARIVVFALAAGAIGAFATATYGQSPPAADTPNSARLKLPLEDANAPRGSMRIGGFMPISRVPADKVTRARYLLAAAENLLAAGRYEEANRLIEDAQELLKDKLAKSSPAATGADAQRASVDGKYRRLLRTIEVPGDRETFTEFHDSGYWSGTSWAGFDDLPSGYWVYAYPRWYIWGEESPKAEEVTDRPPRNWGPEQATGEPNTPQAGDIVTAWASGTPDGQPEWLQTDYADAVMPSAIVIHESYNPGAVHRVTAFREDGTEVEVWSGQDPTPPGRENGVSTIPVKIDFQTKRVRIYLNSPAVAGWNEIDAVGLVDASGQTHWAAHAEASSTYADRAEQPVMTREVEFLRVR